jgi:DNA-3-methyladenine glycosylase II
LPDALTAALKYLAKVDPVMAKIIKRTGRISLPTVAKIEPYRALCRSIAHQQLHGKAAETILGRFKNLFPNCDFPTPEQILAIDAKAIRACGFSENKVLAIRDIAEKTLLGVVPSRREACALSNAELITRLTEIRGVGRWTVEMLLISALGRLDVLPVDDFGVRNGYRKAYNKRKMPTPKQLAAIGKCWEPYGSLAALYLWRAADEGKAVKSAKTKKAAKVTSKMSAKYTSKKLVTSKRKR